MSAAAATGDGATGVSPVPSRPWWEELGAVVPRSVAFARRAARPSQGTGMPPLAANPLAWATVALDELAVSAAYLVSRRHAEEVSAQSLAEAAEAVRRLDAAGVRADPTRAHVDPGRPAQARLTRRHRPGVTFEHLSFPSTYRPPVDLPGTATWSGEEANRRAHAYLLRRGDRCPWAVVLHGHRMGEPRDLRLLGSIRLQRDLDVNVAHLVLPMHGPRGRDGAQPFPGVDAVRNFHGIGQAVADARALLAWLRERDAETIGLFGVSLGGHVAAMLAAFDPRLAAVVAGVPTSDLATMLAETIRSRWGDEAVDASGILADAPRELSRLVSPLTFDPVVPREARFVYGAIGDRLVTPQQALALWQHWDRPAILWLQGGHIANNVGASRRFVAASLGSRGVRGDACGS